MNTMIVDHLAAMKTPPPETPLIFTGVSWDEYVRIADEIGERPGVRVTYDRRYVEIATSDLFPFLTPDVSPDFLEQGLNEGIIAMRRDFRDWVKANRN